MFYKLASANIRRSYKDYLIYFMTLSLAISLFYLFNSIGSQKAMLVLTQTQSESLDLLSQIMNFISFFVSFAIAFLMFYANRFLIKRRKRELGIYLVLGMDRLRIASLIVLETLLIGLLSFAVGIGLGVVASHLLSAITARLLMTDLSSFRFVFSTGALIKAAAFFGLVFLCDMILNIFVIARLQLIDLIYPKRISEIVLFKSPKISALAMLIAIITLGFSYFLIIENGFLFYNFKFTASLILGILGTVIFFMALSGLLKPLIQGCEAYYFKDINIFTTNQIFYRITSTYVMLSIVSIMLLIAIGTFSTGMSIASIMDGNIKVTMPFTASFEQYSRTRDGVDFEVMAKNAGFLPQDFTVVTLYRSGLKLSALAEALGITEKVAQDIKLTPLEASYFSREMPLISLEDYNRARILAHKTPIDLADDQALLIYNIDQLEALYSSQLRGQGEGLTHPSAPHKPLLIGSEEFTVIATQKETLYNNMINQDSGTLVVPQIPQSISSDPQSFYSSVLNLQYDPTSALQENYLVLKEALLKDYIFSAHRQDILENAVGIKLAVAYMGTYVGMVFIISSVVMLSLQQLSEASDNQERYRLLIKIGVEESVIYKALAKQIGIYFILPLVLTAVHATIGIGVARKMVLSFGQSNWIENTLITVAFTLALYLGYYFITLISAKAIIQQRSR